MRSPGIRTISFRCGSALGHFHSGAGCHCVLDHMGIAPTHQWRFEGSLESTLCPGFAVRCADRYPACPGSQFLLVCNLAKCAPLGSLRHAFLRGDAMLPLYVVTEGIRPLLHWLRIPCRNLRHRSAIYLE